MYFWPERKKLRLKWYNYSDNWFYFVTLCTKWRENFFWEIVNWKMLLNDYWKIVENCWNSILKHYQNVWIDEFIIMPNHIHWIIIIVGNEYFRSDKLTVWNLSNIIKWFKIWVTKEVRNKYNDYEFWWQKSFFDKIIKNEEQLLKTQEYIVNNPMKWDLDINNLLNIRNENIRSLHY